MCRVTHTEFQAALTAAPSASATPKGSLRARDAPSITASPVKASAMATSLRAGTPSRSTTTVISATMGGNV